MNACAMIDIHNKTRCCSRKEAIMIVLYRNMEFIIIPLIQIIVNCVLYFTICKINVRLSMKSLPAMTYENTKPEFLLEI